MQEDSCKRRHILLRDDVSCKQASTRKCRAWALHMRDGVDLGLALLTKDRADNNRLVWLLNRADNVRGERPNVTEQPRYTVTQSDDKQSIVVGLLLYYVLPV